MRGNLTGIETPDTSFDFFIFVGLLIFVVNITRKLKLEDRLANRTTEGLYLTLY